MKYFVHAVILASALVMFSCGNKKVSDKPDADTVLAADENIQNGVIQMERSVVEDTAVWKGATYKYKIERVPDSLLPQVKDAETDNVYMDNSISLSIMHGDKEIFNHKFTKDDFKSYLDAGFQKNGILEGFVFDQALPQGLRFATSVSYPASDLYIPLVVLVSSNGSMTITKDNLMDVGSEGDEAN